MFVLRVLCYLTSQIFCFICEKQVSLKACIISLRSYSLVVEFNVYFDLFTWLHFQSIIYFILLTLFRSSALNVTTYVKLIDLSFFLYECFAIYIVECLIFITNDGVFINVELFWFNVQINSYKENFLKNVY